MIPHGIMENTTFFLNGNMCRRIASTFHYGLLLVPVGYSQENQHIVCLSFRRDSCDGQNYTEPIQFCGNVGLCHINDEPRQSGNFLLL